MRRAGPRTSRGSLLVGLVIAVSSCLGAPAIAKEASIDQACPDRMPASSYEDASGAHAQSIACLQWWDVSPITGDRYEPGRAANREEIAAMVARLLDATGYSNVGSTVDYGFDDIADSPYQDAINRLAWLGIIRGTDSNTFSPKAKVSRAQMAAFIIRAVQDVVFRLEMPPGEGFSDTDGTAHEDNIRRLVEAGITQGTSADAFSPGASVSRGQLATFLMRTANLLTEEGLAAPPDRRAMSLGYAIGHVSSDDDYYWSTGGKAVSGGYYTRSIHAWRPSSSGDWIEYDLGRDFDFFRATLGLADDSPADARITFIVSVDGSDAEEVSLRLGETHEVDLNVTGALRLRLYVQKESGTGSYFAAVFADARLTVGDFDQRYVPQDYRGADSVRLGYDRNHVQSDDDYYWSTGSESVNGDEYARTLHAWRPSSSGDWIEFNLGRDFASFSTTIGLADDSPSDARVTFIVSVDGDIRVERTLGLGETFDVDIEVRDALRLRLAVRKEQASESYFSAVFADAIVHR